MAQYYGRLEIELASKYRSPVDAHPHLEQLRSSEEARALTPLRGVGRRVAAFNSVRRLLLHQKITLSPVPSLLSGTGEYTARLDFPGANEQL
ncbi:hypothetical protein EVAR_56170_1 [Eumeta japonica]|uniref:Uncharacterized protein n=1 Tax=Eumeta variegata TaxID=151549 RepID=A0A4C1Y573_EUMVA|nr:hypothetical protein EVAR_56170_1 [Eumeta japonica]